MFQSEFPEEIAGKNVFNYLWVGERGQLIYVQEELRICCHVILDEYRHMI
jgi:hypothetical protein